MKTGANNERVCEVLQTCKAVLTQILADDERRRKVLTQELGWLDKQDTLVRRALREMVAADEATGAWPEVGKRKVFRHDISERMMADALCEVYEELVGSGRLSAIDLMAYLFIMVDTHHYGRDDFHTNGKRPFFEFFVERVRPELAGRRGVTRKTMGNRINREFDCLYLTVRERERMSAGMRRRVRNIEENFHAVCGVFHKTALGKRISR